MRPFCQQAFSFFLPGERLAALEPLGRGLVNDTWLALAESGEKYVLQRLNTAVFPEPALVQENLCRVTEHLRASLPADSSFQVFQVFRSPDGQSAYVDAQGGWWRLLSLLADTQSLNTVASAEQAKELGAALGLFHQLLDSLPPPPLADTLPGFHNTPLYLAKYDALLPTALLPEAADCRDFINVRRADVHLLEDALKQGRVTWQVIHGDPKVGNFLFSADSRQAVSLIDFDTVKPGLLLHDLGDFLRSCCNSLGEEARQPDEIVFDQVLFAAALAGYLSRAADLLKPGERQLIVDSARLISFELGLRFYSDYLAGSHYFKVTCPNQNLFRARAQFALVSSIEEQRAVMAETVAAIN